MIIPLLAAMIQVGSVQTVPSISMDVQGHTTRLDSKVVSDEKDRIVVVYSEPRDTIAMTVQDGTNGLLETTIPTISFNQPMALRNDRTGLVTVYPNVQLHRTPTVVVKDSDSARSEYRIEDRRNENGQAPGFCSPKTPQ